MIQIADRTYAIRPVATGEEVVVEGVSLSQLEPTDEQYFWVDVPDQLDDLDVYWHIKVRAVDIDASEAAQWETSAVKRLTLVWEEQGYVLSDWESIEDQNYWKHDLPTDPRFSLWTERDGQPGDDVWLKLDADGEGSVHGTVVLVPGDLPGMAKIAREDPDSTGVIQVVNVGIVEDTVIDTVVPASGLSNEWYFGVSGTRADMDLSQVGSWLVANTWTQVEDDADSMFEF